LIGAITLVYALGVYGALSGFIIGGVAATGIGWYWTKTSSSNKRQLPFPVKAFLSFAGVYVFTLAGLKALMSLDLFMIKAMLQDDDQTGFYNAAVTLSRISYFLLQGLSFVILPSVSALTKSGTSHTNAAAFIKDILRYLIALIVPSITFAAATSAGLINLFFAPNFLPAADALTILMVGIGALGFYLLLANVVAGAGKATIGLYIIIASIALSYILGLFFIPRFGLIGAAWQTTIAALLGLAALASYTFHTFRIPVPVKSTLNVALASALAVSVTFVWHVSPPFLPLQYIVLFAIYGIVLLFLREVTEIDKLRLARLHPAFQRITKYL
jgi:O-antigen/teichoic acid export membrane protein